MGGPPHTREGSIESAHKSQRKRAALGPPAAPRGARWCDGQRLIARWVRVCRRTAGGLLSFPREPTHTPNRLPPVPAASNRYNTHHTENHVRGWSAPAPKNTAKQKKVDGNFSNKSMNYKSYLSTQKEGGKKKKKKVHTSSPSIHTEFSPTRSPSLSFSVQSGSVIVSRDSGCGSVEKLISSTLVSSVSKGWPRTSVAYRARVCACVCVCG